MIYVNVEWFSESDEEQAKQFIKDIKETPFGRHLFNHDSCSEIGTVQICSTDIR